MPRPVSLSVAAFLCFVPASAQADTPTEAELLANSIPTTAPWFVPEISANTMPVGGPYHNPGTLFINFDGAQMIGCNGSNDPKMNCSTVMTDEVLPWGGSQANRAAVVQLMQSDMEDFAYDVVQARPGDEVDYDMVMVGDWNPPPEQDGFAGVAPTIDCWNIDRGESAFTLDFSSASLVAKITGQEAAHVWGLEHVDSSSDLLFPTTGGASDPVFEDTCSRIVKLDAGQIVTERSIACPDMHAINCPDQPGYQNSYQDLMMVFGPKLGDTVAPVLEIISPLPGEMFPSGADVDVTLGMTEEISPQLFDVWIALNSNMQGDKVGGTSTHYPGPTLTVPLKGLPDGDHMIRVDLGDMSGNTVFDEVSFVIGMSDSGGSTATAGTSSGSGSGSGGGSGGTTSAGSSGGTSSAGTTEDSDSGTGGDTDTAGGENGDSGCGCRNSAPAPLGFSALVLLALVRRRR